MRSINFRLMIFICGILISALVTMGVYSYRLSSSVVEEKTSAAAINSLEQMGKNLDVQMRAVKKYMDMIIYTPEFIDVLQTNSFDKTSYDTVIGERAITDLLDAVFFDDNTVKSFMVYKGERCVVKYRSDLFDGDEFKKTDTYKNTLASNGAIYFGGTLKVQDATGEDIPYIGYGRKLSDYRSSDNTDAGSVFLFLDEKTFSTIIDVTGVPGKIFITGQDGRILSYRDKSSINENLKDNPDYQKAYESNASGYYISKHSRGDTSVIIYYTLPQWNLKIVQEIPRKDFTGETDNIIIATTDLCLLVFALLVIAAIFLSRSVAGPVKKIKAAMKSLQNGNFDTRLNVKSRNEFGSIAVSFNYMAVQLKELFDRLIMEERRRNETEISMLQYQINPHFLYNVLATIRLSAVASKDSDTAEMLQKLSRLLKRTLANAGRMVPLEIELNNIRDFMDMQKVLYSGEINTILHIDEQSRKCFIPNMLLQPIVENAIIHGFGEKVENPEIRISSCMIDGKLRIVIEDNGSGMTAEKLEELKGSSLGSRMSYNRVGVMNVNMRIKLYFGGEYGLWYESSIGKGTKAIIVVPEVVTERNGS